MFNRTKELVGELAGKARVWNRERKERAEEKRAAEQDPAGVTVPLWLVNAAKFASWVATLSLMYFLWLYTLDIARDRSGAMHLTHVGQWVGDIQFWFPYIAGFALIAFGIPYVAKIAIPTFMSLSWRGNFWPKLWALFIAVAVSLVVIAGTFTVQGDTIMERDRDAAVAVGQVEQDAAVLASRIADKRAELDDMVNNANVYVRTAASMSPAAYDVFVEQRRDDWQYDRLRSYRATAVDAQRLRDEIAALRDQQARSTVVAAVQGEVTTERTTWIADTLGWLEGARAILLSLVMDIVALMMPWIALRLEQARNQQMGFSEDARVSRWDLIEDKQAGRITPEAVDRRSAQDVVDAMIAGGANPRFAADMARATQRSAAKQTTLKDAHTDETIVDKDGHLATIVREHTRKVKGKDGKPIQILVPAAPPPPDETGVAHDGAELARNGAGVEQAMSGAMVEEREELAAGSVKEEPRDEPADGEYGRNSSDEFAEQTLHDGEETPSAKETDDAPEPVTHTEPPSDETLDWEALLPPEPSVDPAHEEPEQPASDSEDSQSDHVVLADNEGVVVIEDEPEAEQDERVIPRAALMPAK